MPITVINFISHLISKDMENNSKRKLTMPPRHIPYLEKHRIYDLFHELARELVIQQPPDHVLFIKQILYQAAKNTEVSRVIILSSPNINRCEIASQISHVTKQTVVSESNIMVFFPEKKRSDITPFMLAKCLGRLLRTEQKQGWILIDCIKTAVEAKAMLQEGILPTHVIYLISPFNPPLNELLYCHVHESWPEYRREMMSVRNAFKHCLVEVHLEHRDILGIVEQCVEIINIRKDFGGPKQPRVVLLGPRGSGRKTQAATLVEKLKLVHVNFEHILCQAWISQSELGEQLRACKDRVCFQSNLLAKVVDERILQSDCLEKGWILTGFPFTEKDFRYLDCLDTPPNRVIFLDCDLNKCKERLINLRINIYTGSISTLPDDSEFILDKTLAVHPKDTSDIIDAELTYYCEQYGALRKYCGETASVVNADQPQHRVYEYISAIIVRTLPACSPRNPWLSEREEDIPCSETCSCDSSNAPILNSVVNQL